MFGGAEINPRKRDSPLRRGKTPVSAACSSSNQKKFRAEECGFRHNRSGQGHTVGGMTQRDDREPEAPVVAVVLAAGFGTRFDPDNPKQLVSVDDKPIVCWSIEAFEQNPHVTDTIVVVNPQVRDEVERLVDEAGYPKVRMIIDGGAERADSTAAALQALGAAGIPPRAKLLIHDAVRPFVEQSSIDGCITALDEFEAATVAFASTDTMLFTEDLGDRKVVRSVPTARTCSGRRLRRHSGSRPSAAHTS